MGTEADLRVVIARVREPRPAFEFRAYVGSHGRITTNLEVTATSKTSPISPLSLVF